MPTTRTRRTRRPAEEFSPELIAWARGEGPFPIEAYFLMPAARDRLMSKHGVPGVEPLMPREQPRRRRKPTT